MAEWLCMHVGAWTFGYTQMGIHLLVVLMLNSFGYIETPSQQFIPQIAVINVMSTPVEVDIEIKINTNGLSTLADLV